MDFNKGRKCLYNQCPKKWVPCTELKFNKKIQHAEKEWVPYIIIIGEKEIKSGNITLRIRNGGQIVTTITRFTKELESKLKEYPKIPQHLPVFVSKQININSL